MRFVVDTNIFVSAALKESSWRGAIVRWLDHFGGFLKSDATERQVFAVLQRGEFAQKMPPAYLERVRQIFGHAERVAIKKRPSPPCAKRARASCPGSRTRRICCGT
jgi:hypothetical protein